MRFPTWLVWKETGTASSVWTAQPSGYPEDLALKTVKLETFTKYGISSRENLCGRSDASSPLVIVIHSMPAMRPERLHSLMAPSLAGQKAEWETRGCEKTEHSWDFCGGLKGTLKCFLAIDIIDGTTRFMSWQRDVADICLTWSCHCMIQSGQSHSSYGWGVPIWKAVHPQNLIWNLTMEPYSRTRGDFFWTQRIEIHSFIWSFIKYSLSILFRLFGPSNKSTLTWNPQLCGRAFVFLARLQQGFQQSFIRSRCNIQKSQPTWWLHCAWKFGKIPSIFNQHIVFKRVAQITS